MPGPGPIVYRLGRHPFTVQRGVRFPLGLFEGKGAALAQIGSSFFGAVAQFG